MKAFVKVSPTTAITTASVRALQGTIVDVTKHAGGMCTPDTFALSNYPYTTLKPEWITLLPELGECPAPVLVTAVTRVLNSIKTPVVPPAPAYVAPTVSKASYDALKNSNTAPSPHSALTSLMRRQK